MKTFYETQEEVCSKYDLVLSDLTGTEDLATLKQIKSCINRAAETFYDSYKCWWMEQEDMIGLLAKYDTGTLTATAASAALTGDSTVWTRDMAGQKIIITDDTDGAVAYRIKSFSSVTGLTLTTKYIHTGGAGLSYKILYDTYDLAPDFKTVSVMQDSSPLPSLFNDDQYMLTTSVTSSFPVEYRIIARTDSYYDTGTVVVAANDTEVTGTSTVWDDYVIGRYIQLGNYGRLYEITARASQVLTIGKGFGGAAVSAGNYKIDPVGSKQIRYYAAPDTAQLIPYSYWQRHIRLTADNDISPIPSETLLVDGGIWQYGKDRDHPAAQIAEQAFYTEAGRLAVEKMADYQTSSPPMQG